MSELRTRRFRGDRLREAREAKRLSQSQLADRIGAHVTSISDWERERNAPSGRHVASLTRELGVEASYLYGDDADEEDALAPLTREQQDLLATLADALAPFRHTTTRSVS